MIKKKFYQMNSDFIVKKSKSMKGNTLMNSIVQNKKKIPSILINSKNSEIFNLKELNESNETKENNTDYKNTNLILKQKSLALSKTNKNFFKNKILSQNEIQKKQSYNNLLKYKSNNYFPIKNNFIKNIPSLSQFKRDILLNNKENNLTNSSNYYDFNFDSDIYQKSSIIPTITTKHYDFEISEEDKMFDQYLLKRKKTKKKIKIKLRHKIKSDKKKLNFFNSYEAPLKKVYKKIPQIMNKIELTKKLKNSFSLLKYQNLLFDIGSKNLDWDSKAKLNNEFTNLRNRTNKEYELLRKSVRDIEKKEKKIIDNINRQQNHFKKNMKENNYYCMTIGMNFHSIPNIKFHRTVTKFKCKNKV